MSEDTKAEPIPALAEHWARKGAAEVEKMDATINLARHLMASEEVEHYAEGENPYVLVPYPWEVSEPKSDAPRRIFLGTVSELATGTGHTVHFSAGIARDEDEFRRQLAAHIGHTLANGAKVRPGLEEIPFSRTFISPQLRQTLQKFDEGKRAPARFHYLCQWYENRS
ncbi:hypothetical protein [Erythrobacter sp. SD-21]|uniref:hypothetical protein n=1 Tax=Erythrobacter sp. SD-21 TaxID=161528 RepID=UPI000153EFCE|nr:hypothetical protein [Erythrobacter sp. SD-21]EDL47992.1 hypothetical protein ED21_25637 [Erythrobacter sp. SD-21]